MRILISCMVVLALIVPASAWAFSVRLESRDVAGGDSQVDVVLDTEGRSYNAFELDIESPTIIQSIERDESIIKYWIDHTITQSRNAFVSGIAPLGFSGEGLIARFTTRRIGPNDTFEVTFNAVDHTSSHTIQSFTSSLNHEVVDVPTPAQPEDDTTPPVLDVVVVQDSLLQGQDVIQIDVHDRQNNVDSVLIDQGDGFEEVHDETVVLRTTRDDNTITVRALDSQGNTVEQVIDYHDETDRESLLWLVVILVALLCILFLLIRKRHNEKTLHN